MLRQVPLKGAMGKDLGSLSLASGEMALNHDMTSHGPLFTVPQAISQGLCLNPLQHYQKELSPNTEQRGSQVSSPGLGAQGWDLRALWVLELWTAMENSRLREELTVSNPRPSLG